MTKPKSTSLRGFGKPTAAPAEPPPPAPAPAAAEAAPAPRRGGRPKATEEKVPVILRMTADQRRQLHRLALDDDSSVQVICERALNAHFRSLGLQPPFDDR